jgi:hypothetical protein
MVIMFKSIFNQFLIKTTGILEATQAMDAVESPKNNGARRFCLCQASL